MNNKIAVARSAVRGRLIDELCLDAPEHDQEWITREIEMIIDVVSNGAMLIYNELLDLELVIICHEPMLASKCQRDPRLAWMIEANMPWLGVAR